MMYITAHDSINPLFWIVPLVVIGGICLIFTLFELFTDAHERTIATFGVLAFVCLSGAGWLWWNDHTIRTVELSSNITNRLTVDEDQLRQWRGDEAGMNLVYSHINAEGVPVFKDFSNPSKQVYRQCPLIFTDEQRESKPVFDNRELRVKITPRCSNITTDGELVPISTPKPMPSPTVTKRK